MIHIAMIEDDQELCELLGRFLESENMKVTCFHSPLTFLESLVAEHYDLAIIDLTLPHMDGLELCAFLHDKKRFPFIISSARTDINDKLIGLERGADDYLPKPYDPRELLARIHAILRRYQHPLSMTQASKFIVDEAKMIIKLDNKNLELTLAEYEILKLLIEKKGCVLSRDMIADNVSAMKWESTERSIDVVISRIRKKLGDNPKQPIFIKAIKGVGYKFIG